MFFSKKKKKKRAPRKKTWEDPRLDPRQHRVLKQVEGLKAYGRQANKAVQFQKGAVKTALSLLGYGGDSGGSRTKEIHTSSSSPVAAAGHDPAGEETHSDDGVARSPPTAGYHVMVSTMNNAAMNLLRRQYEPDVLGPGTYPPVDQFEYSEGSFVSSFPEQNVIRYHLTRRVELRDRPSLPCVLYFHGGGMAILCAFYSFYRSWARTIASQGDVAVIFVDFRNSLVSGVVDGEHSTGQVAPYPGGLNDCVAAVHWARREASSLRIDPNRIIVAGESGGGNLAVATGLRLLREAKQTPPAQEGGGGGRSSSSSLLRSLPIHGIYALCPYLCGKYPDPRFPSSSDNNGILLTLDRRGPIFCT